MSKSVVFSTCSRISCAGQSSPEVVLCLIDDLLESGRSTIDGILTKVYKDNTGCGNPVWRYVVSYDETLLVDPDVVLISTDVTGIFCKGCLTTWVDDEIRFGAIPIINIPAIEVAAASLTNAYVALNFLDAEGKARFIHILNNTNQDIQISYDGTTDGPIAIVGETRDLNYAAGLGILEATDIWIKYLNGVAPTLGEVLMDGYY